MNRLSGIVAGCRELAAALRTDDPESADYMDARAVDYLKILYSCRHYK